MEIIVELNVHNTEKKGEVPSNMTVTVYLDSIWQELKQHNRVYLSTKLIVPVIRNQQREILEITLNEYYYTETISSGERGYFVIMKGFIEGEIANIEEITTQCLAWSYDCM